MKLFTIRRVLLSTGLLLAGGMISAALFGNEATATVPAIEVSATAAPTDAQVADLLGRLANGRNARPEDRPVVEWALDSTRGYARVKECGFTRFEGGTKLSDAGEWKEADLYGKTSPSIGDASSQASARAKLSYHNGLCYLATTGKGVYRAANARQGAVRRLALAYSRKIGGEVRLTSPDGKTLGVYRWSAKWDR